jgi:lysophospholipase L1-like esterase
MHIVLRSTVALAFLTGVASAEDFAIRDGDVVGLMGDSITAARTYGKVIENYTLLRFPERKVHFINVGKGGETAAGALERLDRDVFGRGVTLLTVAYGINDIGWGTKADDEHRQAYLDGIATIVKRCNEHGVRVYICSAAITAADPSKSEDDYLQKMCDDGMEVAKKQGGHAIDVQRTMREIQKKVWQANRNADDSKPAEKNTLHAADGIHLNDLGQLAMGYAILKGLGAPEEVSSATIDAAAIKVIDQKGCAISDVGGETSRIEFTRLDEGLPLNAETFFALNFRFIPIPDELNRYVVTVKNLPPGRYTLTADGRGVGTWSAEHFANGINIASATTDGWLPGGPWDAQANILSSLTEARDRLDMARLRANSHLPATKLASEQNTDIAEANSQIETQQREAAKPRPYHFVIERAEIEGDGAKSSR